MADGAAKPSSSVKLVLLGEAAVGKVCSRSHVNHPNVARRLLTSKPGISSHHLC